MAPGVGRDALHRRHGGVVPGTAGTAAQRQQQGVAPERLAAQAEGRRAVPGALPRRAVHLVPAHPPAAARLASVVVVPGGVVRRVEPPVLDVRQRSGGPPQRPQAVGPVEVVVLGEPDEPPLGGCGGDLQQRPEAPRRVAAADGDHRPARPHQVDQLARHIAVGDVGDRDVVARLPERVEERAQRQPLGGPGRARLAVGLRGDAVVRREAVHPALPSPAGSPARGGVTARATGPACASGSRAGATPPGRAASRRAPRRRRPRPHPAGRRPPGAGRPASA